MRLASLNGHLHVVDADLRQASAIPDSLPIEGQSFLAAGGLEAIADVIAAGRLRPARVIRPDDRFDPPVSAPRMVWAAGLNYRDHAAEVGAAIPDTPTFFVKAPGSLVGHGVDVVVPPFVTEPDYEGELALVIGRRSVNLTIDNALDAVAGVTCANDMSARDHQFRTGQWTWSKSFDTFCPLGPTLVTLDELDLGALDIETSVNGEVVQSSATSEWVFSAAELLSSLSQCVTLEPGDVLLTGTPAGVGMGRTPPRYLQDGDVVEVSIDGVGTLKNRVIAPKRTRSQR